MYDLGRGQGDEGGECMTLDDVREMKEVSV